MIFKSFLFLTLWLLKVLHNPCMTPFSPDFKFKEQADPEGTDMLQQEHTEPRAKRILQRERDCISTEEVFFLLFLHFYLITVLCCDLYLIDIKCHISR